MGLFRKGTREREGRGNKKSITWDAGETCERSRIQCYDGEDIKQSTCEIRINDVRRTRWDISFMKRGHSNIKFRSMRGQCGLGDSSRVKRRLQQPRGFVDKSLSGYGRSRKLTTLCRQVPVLLIWQETSNDRGEREKQGAGLRKARLGEKVSPKKLSQLLSGR